MRKPKYAVQYKFCRGDSGLCKTGSFTTKKDAMAVAKTLKGYKMTCVKVVPLKS